MLALTVGLQGLVAKPRWSSLAVGLVLPCTAFGAPPRTSISVTASATALECPDSLELVRRVETILERRLPVMPSTAGVDVRVEFDRGPEGYVARLRFGGDKPGERELRDGGPRCEALADAVSVAIALVFDRELPHPSAAPPASAEAGPSTSPPARPKPTDPRLGATLVSELRASAGAGVTTGYGDGPAALMTTDLGLRLADTWLLLGGIDAVLPSATAFEGGEVRTSLQRVTLRGCYVFGERLIVGPCVWGGIGRLHGAGVGYDNPRSSDLLWSAVGGGAVTEVEVWRPLFLGLSAVLWRPLRKQSFSVENAGVAWESSAASGVIALRAGVRVE